VGPQGGSWRREVRPSSDSGPGGPGRDRGVCPSCTASQSCHLMGIRAMIEVLPMFLKLRSSIPLSTRRCPITLHIRTSFPLLRQTEGSGDTDFHGTSNSTLHTRAAEMLGKPAEDLKIVTCHLGNGSSISAVKGASQSIQAGFRNGPWRSYGNSLRDIDPTLFSPYGT
jgi:acetate kinase